MGQTAQNTTTFVDQEDVEQAIPGVIKTPGTFLSAQENKKIPGPGPLFTAQNQPVGKDIRPASANHELIEKLDIKRLVGMLTQELIKIGNLDTEHITENDRKKILQMLYISNPKKYPFVSVNEEEFVQEEEEILPETKKKVGSPSSFLNPPTPLDTIIETAKVTPTSKILRSNKFRLGPPKLTLVRAQENTREEYTKIEAEKPKVSIEELVDSLHTPVIEEKPQPIATPEVNPIPIETPGTLEKKQMLASVAKVFDTFNPRFGTNWKKWAVPLALVVKDDVVDINKIIDGQQSQLVSWRESPRTQELSSFLSDITTLSEEQLITKYIPSYVDLNNPSSWASVSGFSAYEIINGEEGVYGLTSDRRLEISSLLKQLGTIDEELDATRITGKYASKGIHTYQDYISLNPKYTIHEYYDEIRKGIASADNRTTN